jgi:hypothetical protein
MLFVGELLCTALLLWLLAAVACCGCWLPAVACCLMLRLLVAAVGSALAVALELSNFGKILAAVACYCGIMYCIVAAVACCCGCWLPAVACCLMLRLLVAAVGSALAVALGLSNFGKFLVGSLELVIKRSQHRCRIDSVRNCRISRVSYFFNISRIWLQCTCCRRSDGGVVVLRLVQRFVLRFWYCGFGAAVLMLRFWCSGWCSGSCCGLGAAVLVLRFSCYGFHAGIWCCEFGATVFMLRRAAHLMLRFWCCGFGAGFCGVWCFGFGCCGFGCCGFGAAIWCCDLVLRFWCCDFGAAVGAAVHYILGPTGGPGLQWFWHVPFMVGMLATDGPPIHGFKTLLVVPSAPSFYEYFPPLIIYLFHVTHDSLLSKDVWFIYYT